MIDVLRLLLCKSQAEWAERPPNKGNEAKSKMTHPSYQLNHEGARSTPGEITLMSHAPGISLYQDN